MIEPIRWQTEEAHANNSETMQDYLSCHNMLDITCIDGTYAENALKHGVGGINVDGCLVGTEIIKTYGRGKQSGATPIVPLSPE